MGRMHVMAELCVSALMLGASGCRMPVAMEATVKQGEMSSALNEWEKFDPRSGDLAIEIVSEKTEDGVAVACLTFTSHSVSSQPVRIYGIYARPVRAKGRLPGLLFIHGAGQTADEPEVVGMARHGYAVFSHAWERPERADQTNFASRWPFDSQGNRLKGDPYLDSPAWLARRALTLLERQPGVDPRRLGVYGFSFGGRHTWTLAATDARVKAANPSCGVMLSPPLMGRLKAPVLFTSATGDFFAQMDLAQELMEPVTVEHRRLIAPNENHNMAGTGWEATRLKWFDHYLKGAAPLPASPVLSARTNGSVTTVTVDAPAATACQLIYSYGTNVPASRCWFGKAMPETARGLFSTELPRQAGVAIWYFANSEYGDGTALSTAYTAVEADPAVPEGKPGENRLLYDPATDGVYPWYFSWLGPVNDHPWHSWGGTWLTVSENVAGRPALHVESELPGTNGFGRFRGFMRSPACPLRKADHAGQLRVNVFGERPLRVTVIAYAEGNWSAARNPFHAVVEETSGQGWCSIDLPVGLFKRQDPTTKQDMTMDSFDGIRQFHLTVESADRTRRLPAIGQLSWIP